MDRFDVVIVGGGISGASLAHFCLEAGYRTALVEAQTRLGGSLNTARLDGGFWLELGAHTAYNSYTGLIEILEARRLMGRLLPREKVKWMFCEDGQPVSIVKKLNFPELLVSLPRLLTRKRAGASVEAYYSAVLGRGNFQRVAAPMISAVVSQDARGFPADSLFKKRGRRKDVLRSFTIEGGLQGVVEAICDDERLTMFPGTAAEGVETDGGSFAVRAGGRGIEAGALALAVPPDAAASLLGGVAGSLAGLLAGFTVNTVHSVGVRVAREQVVLPPVAGLIAPKAPFHSVVSRDTVPHPNSRGFAFHFKDGEEEAQRRCMADVLGVGLEACGQVVRTENRLPALRTGHEHTVAEIDRELSGRNLLLTGNYFDGMAIEDCIQRSKREAGRLTAHFPPPA